MLINMNDPCVLKHVHMNKHHVEQKEISYISLSAIKVLLVVMECSKIYHYN